MTTASLDQIKTGIETKTGVNVAVEGNAVVVPKDAIRTVGSFLKNDPACQMDYLSSLTGVDYKDRMEIVYHLYSMAKKKGPITLKVRTEREKSSVPSVTPVWRGAEFQEREVFDLLGIHFEGHPDLRRILMWDGFEYHPLRKDYVPEGELTPEKTTAPAD